MYDERPQSDPPTNDYSAEKDTEKLTEEEVLEQMHGSPELRG